MNVCSRDVVMLPLLFQQVVETSLVDQDYQHTVKKISAHMITTQDYEHHKVNQRQK